MEPKTKSKRKSENLDPSIDSKRPENKDVDTDREESAMPMEADIILQDLLGDYSEQTGASFG
jgi:hypothetical protein